MPLDEILLNNLPIVLDNKTFVYNNYLDFIEKCNSFCKIDNSFNPLCKTNMTCRIDDKSDNENLKEITDIFNKSSKILKKNGIFKCKHNICSINTKKWNKIQKKYTTFGKIHNINDKSIDWINGPEITLMQMFQEINNTKIIPSSIYALEKTFCQKDSENTCKTNTTRFKTLSTNLCKICNTDQNDKKCQECNDIITESNKSNFNKKYRYMLQRWENSKSILCLKDKCIL